MPEMNWLFLTPVAHRGLHDAEKPENSMSAFRAAIEHGFTIEIDVHLSSDGHLVVFHDDNLKRVCGVDKKVAKCTLAELKTMKLKGTEETIPTFDEFLALVDGKVGILCEIKGLNPYDNSISAAVCERLKTYKGKIDSEEQLREFITEVGGDYDKIAAKAMTDIKIQRALRANMLLGQNLGVRGTPFFILDGEVIRGAINDYSVFEDILKRHEK